jgi:hypothetical protein
MSPFREVVRCPICRREVAWKGNPYRPFCSDRCKLMDLGNWASERYRIPQKDPPPSREDDEQEE